MSLFFIHVFNDKHKKTNLEIEKLTHSEQQKKQEQMNGGGV